MQAALLEASHQGRNPQDQQHIAQDRSDDGGPDHIHQPLAQRKQTDDQFGCIAERREEQPTDALAGMFSHLLHRLPDQSS